MVVTQRQQSSTAPIYQAVTQRRRARQITRRLRELNAARFADEVTPVALRGLPADARQWLDRDELDFAEALCAEAASELMAYRWAVQS